MSQQIQMQVPVNHEWTVKTVATTKELQETLNTLSKDGFQIYSVSRDGKIGAAGKFYIIAVKQTLGQIAKASSPLLAP